MRYLPRLLKYDRAGPLEAKERRVRANVGIGNIQFKCLAENLQSVERGRGKRTDLRFIYLRQTAPQLLP